MILFSLFLPFFSPGFCFSLWTDIFSLSYNRWKPNAHIAKSNAVRTSQGGRWEKLDLWDDNYVIGYYQNDSHIFCMEAGAGGSQWGAERGCLFSPPLPGDCGLSSCLKVLMLWTMTQHGCILWVLELSVLALHLFQSYLLTDF